MKMAKATKADIDALQKFLTTLEQITEDGEDQDGNVYDDEALAEFVRSNMRGNVGLGHWRVTMGCDILIDNCCDPDQTYLEWKPDIKKLIPETHNEAGERLFYIISYKNSERGLINFWGANNAGYTYNIRRAGKYPESKVREQMDYYHQGEAATAVPVEEIHDGRYQLSENVWMNYDQRQIHKKRVADGVLVEEKEVNDATSKA